MTQVFLPTLRVPQVNVSELEADPHGVYRQHRSRSPVIETDRKTFIVLRAADLAALIRDDRLAQAGTKIVDLHGVTAGPLYDMFRYGMLTANGDDHRRRRVPFSKLFSAPMVSMLRSAVRISAESLIDRFQADGHAELTSQYAALLPAHVLSQVLGLQAGELDRFMQIVYSVSRIISFTFSPDDLTAMQADAISLYKQVSDLLEFHHGSFQSTFLSRYLDAVAERAELSPVETVVQIMLVIIGGMDTTRAALASQTSLLLQHREQWEALCHDPALTRQAVGESMRFEPSVGSFGRLTREDVSIGDALIPEGRLVILSSMSAMRDETVYDQPDRFNIHRSDLQRSHPIFGGGAHRCLGESLAWLELEEGLSALVQRLPNLRLSGSPPRIQGHMGIRRVSEMFVNWR